MTVSERLSTLTGYNIFHNHLTVDLARSLFERSDPEFAPYVQQLRLDGFERAAAKGLPGLIFTYCYAHSEDEPFIHRVVDLIEAQNGQVCFVHIVCDEALLEKRVISENRQRYGKIKRIEGLRQVMTRYDLITAIPGVANLRIDNSQLGQEVVARRIANHYGLPLREA